jgi:CO/xanthine dehydrogenase FAD-binding subunit
MKPASFEYERPATLEEALELLADDALESRPLAGGQSLVPLMNFRLARPERLVDLNGIGELAYVRRAGGVLRIGAMTRQAALERSPEAAEGWPLLGKALAHLGHPQIRNRGTVGGSIAHADPTAELPVAATALGATLHVRSVRGARALRCEDLFLGALTTTLEPDELLVEVELPPQPERCGTAFVEFARRHGDFALGGAAVRLAPAADGTCASAVIVLLGSGPVAARAPGAEALLAGARLDAGVLARAAEEAVRDARPSGDVHGGPGYRRELLATMVRRGLEQAAREVT